MNEEKAYQCVVDIKEKIKNDELFSKNIVNVGRKAKRMMNYIISEGLISALLFAYSKAKYYQLKDYESVIENVVKNLNDKNEWGENIDWLVVCKYVVDILQELLPSDASEDLVPEELIKKLLDTKNVLVYEHIILNSLDPFAKLCLSYSKGGD